MNLTPAQRAAVEHRGSNLLVSASAGSGKTEVLSRRCLSLITDPRAPCGVERLLVVTFTRAAAAELRVRIADMLRAQAAQTRDATLRDHLRRQEVLVEAADIGTIDAWCGRIVRTHAAEAGVDPTFTMLSEEEARLLRRQTLDALLKWVYAADDPTAEQARAWLRRHKRPDDDFMRDLVLRLNEFRENLIDEEAWLARQREQHARPAEALRAAAAGVLAAALAEECRFLAAQVESLLPATASVEGGTLMREVQETLSSWAARAARPVVDLPALLEEIAGWRPFPSRGVPPADAALLAEVQKCWIDQRLRQPWRPAEMRTALEGAADAAELAATLLALEQRFHEALSAVKRERAAYEFADVLRLTLNLLGAPRPDGSRAPTEIARRLQERYEHVLVDEYQDTSPVQVEILRLVTRGAPHQSNRFMVGDVKQSIYGFRRAEPRLFSKLVRAFSEGLEEGKVHYLADNFRSHPRLLEGLNRVFARLFHPALGGTPFGPDERLRAGREELANPTLDGRPRITLHLIADEPADAAADSDGVPLERVEREAWLTAGMIAALLRDGVQIPVKDEHKRLTLRPLRLSDVVVLLRSARWHAAVVARVLRQAGIPCVTGGRDPLFDVPEVNDVRTVLTLLVNRRQDVPLAAYLRGPLVGLSAAELLRVRAAAEEGTFWDAVTRCCGWTDESGAASPAPLEPPPPAHPLSAKVRAALEQLERWSRVAREEELPELLRRVYQESGLPLFAAALPGGEHRVALLRAIENFAADFARQGHHGVAEFVAYLEDLAATELEPGLPLATGENAVRVMTIHAAKGQEFPIVFLLNTGGEFNRRRGSAALQCDEEGGLGLRFFDYPARAEIVSARHPLLARQAVLRDLEEELRLLYVAMTRARERLILVGHAPPAAWSEARLRYGPAPPPLASRMSVANMREWLLMAVAAKELHAGGEETPPLVQVVEHAPEHIRPSVSPAPPDRVAGTEWSADDEAWVRRATTLLTTPIDATLARWPAVVSVSALKELAARQRDQDASASLDRPAAVLELPRWAASAEGDGREVGIACHRFLQHVHWGELEDENAVRGQLQALVAQERLSPQEAELVPVADVAWLALTPLGLLLARHAASIRRELPFVYTLSVGGEGPATIIRGIIDCLFETPDGVVIVDYKTDRVADGADFQRRVAAYSVQLQVYARAIGQIRGCRVAAAWLVFLSLRRLVAVSLSAEPLERILASSMT